MEIIKVKWHKIVNSDKPSVVRMDLGNGTEFKLVSFFYQNRIFVAIERCGAFSFDTERYKSGYYVSEKLNICVADANIIADWINTQTNIEGEQQGIYYKEYINDNRDLCFYEIIKPIIINDDNIKENLPFTFYDDH